MKNLVLFLIVFYVYRCSTAKKESTEIILDRIFMYYADPDYVTDVKTSVGRLGRGSNYVMNFSLYIIHPWYNNVTMTMTSFEFKDNQYKQSFIQLKDKVCDVFQKPLFWFPLRSVQKYGNFPKKCPMHGHKYVENFQMDLDTFPKNFPSSKWRFNFSASYSFSKKPLCAVSISMIIQESQARKSVRKISSG